MLIMVWVVVFEKNERRSVNTMKFQNRNDERDILSTIEWILLLLFWERERENENENERAAIFRIGRKRKFQRRNAIKSLPLTLKTPINYYGIATKRRGVFISRKRVCLSFLLKKKSFRNAREWKLRIWDPKQKPTLHESLTRHPLPVPSTRARWLGTARAREVLKSARMHPYTS